MSSNLRVVAVGQIMAGSEIQWKVAPVPEPPLEDQLEAAIERAQEITRHNRALLDEIGYMDSLLDDLRSGRTQPLIRLSDAQLEALDEEPVGGEIARQPYLW